MGDIVATYDIHDNGGRSFRVKVENDRNLTLYRSREPNDDSEYGAYLFENSPCLVATSDQVFIGKSPRTPATLFSGGHGPRFDGNTILFRAPGGDAPAENLNYVHVGRDITKFTALSRIVRFVSPVGNSDVPYPYAVDVDDNTYLIIEGVILAPSDRCPEEDPYDYYYREHRISHDLGRVGPPPPRVAGPGSAFQFRGVCEFWLDEELFTFCYNPHPKQKYRDLAERFPGPMRFVYVDCPRKINITKEEYVDYMQALGRHMGFIPLKLLKLRNSAPANDAFSDRRHWKKMGV